MFSYPYVMEFIAELAFEIIGNAVLRSRPIMFLVLDIFAIVLV